MGVGENDTLERQNMIEIGYARTISSCGSGVIGPVRTGETIALKVEVVPRNPRLTDKTHGRLNVAEVGLDSSIYRPLSAGEPALEHVRHNIPNVANGIGAVVSGVDDVAEVLETLTA